MKIYGINLGLNSLVHRECYSSVEKAFDASKSLLASSVTSGMCSMLSEPTKPTVYYLGSTDETTTWIVATWTTLDGDRKRPDATAHVRIFELTLSD
jgi:hypothetical protein